MIDQGCTRLPCRRGPFTNHCRHAVSAKWAGEGALTLARRGSAHRTRQGPGHGHSQTWPEPSPSHRHYASSRWSAHRHPGHRLPAHRYMLSGTGEVKNAAPLLCTITGQLWQRHNSHFLTGIAGQTMANGAIAMEWTGFSTVGKAALPARPTCWVTIRTLSASHVQAAHDTSGVGDSLTPTQAGTSASMCPGIAR